MDEKRKNQIKLILEFDVKSTAQIFMPCWKAGIIQFLSGKWNLFTCKCVQVFLPSNNGCHANPMFRARCSCKISSNIRILTAWKFGLEEFIFGNCSYSYKSKRSFALSLTNLAIDKDDVAAGDGAFLTCRTRLPMSPTPPSNTKSSTRFPSWSMACARTPAGPLKQANTGSNGNVTWLRC